MRYRDFFAKIKESFISVFPITIFIFILLFSLGVPVSQNNIIKLVISAVLLIFGVAIFSMGADSSMIELGSGVGSTLSKKNKLLFMLVWGFIIGFIITFAEPDLMVLSKQVAECSSLSSFWVFIATVSLGVGILLVLGILRIIFRLRLSILLAISYGIVFLLSFFVPSEFAPIAFASGSVTTGPISVPFLIAFGLGLSAVRSSKSDDDSFGLIALCSVGPLITIMILSLFLKSTTPTIQAETIVNIPVWQEILNTLLSTLKEVSLVLLPIVILFAIFQIFFFKYPKTKVVSMCIGLLLTYLGISLFITGVVCGYMPIGKLLGKYLSSLSYKWISIPIGFALGAFAIVAEPALHVLKKQVEDLTSGAIKQKVITITVSVGVALSVCLAVVMALYPFNILYVLLPLFIISIVLAFINTNLFTAVAFDAGGVSTGAMAVSFILPMVMGISGGGNGFSTLAFISSFPILTMQILGLIYKIGLVKKQKLNTVSCYKNDYIVEFDYEKDYEKSSIKQDEIIEFDYKKGSKN